jgi:hypothetical protein
MGDALDLVRASAERVKRSEGMRAGAMPATRFMPKVKEAPSGCLEWTGSKSPQGYGQFHWRSESVNAHRWIYEAANGPIQNNLVIDHLCRNRSCVNLEHLECVSMAENTRRGMLHVLQKEKAKGKTQCIRGHPLFGANVIMNSKGQRSCKTCQRAKAAEWRAQNREHVNEQQRIRRAAA